MAHTIRIRDSAGSTTVHFTVSFYDDGRVGELWVDMHKFGSMLRDWVAQSARAFSYMLQHRIHVVEVCKLHIGKDADPHGEVRGLPGVERCTSVMDAIAQGILCLYSDSARNLDGLRGPRHSCVGNGLGGHSEGPIPEREYEHRVPDGLGQS